MKKTVLILVVGFLLIAVNLYAAGDLIVDGKVGIGTTSPRVKLHVKDSGGAELRVEGDAQAQIRLQDNSDGDVYWIHNNGDKLYFLWNGGSGDTWTIDRPLTIYNANVGINTTSPSKKLYVNGSAGGTQSWNASDIRRKKDIETISGALEGIMQIRGVKYSWKEGDADESKGFDDKVHFGVIAQEVEPFFPELVDHLGNTEEYKHVEYNGLVGILVEAIKELKAEKDAEIEQLKLEIAALKAKLQ